MMKKILLALILSGGSLLFAQSVQAATYTVGGSGSTYSTIQSCINAAQPGDTCLIENGTYYESLHLVRSGTPSAPITIQARNSRQVTVNSGGDETISAQETNFGYIVIDGLRMISTMRDRNYSINLRGRWDDTWTSPNNPDSGVRYITVKNCYIEGAIQFQGHHNTVENCELNGRNVVGDGIEEEFGFSHHNTYRNNTIYGYTERGIWVMQVAQDTTIIGNVIRDGEGMGIDCDGAGKPVHRCRVLNNTVTNIGGEGTGIELENCWDCTIDGNKISRTVDALETINYGQGPDFDTDNGQEYRDDNANMVLKNNIAFNNSRFGLVCYGSPGNKFYNNTLVGNHGAMSFQAYGGHPCHNWEVRNNIFSNNGSAINVAGGNLQNFTVSHNLFNSDGSSGSNAITGNPLFTSDYHLQSGSPAINAGISLSAVTQDVDCGTRPSSGLDIGADEYGVSGTCSTASYTPPPSPSPTPTPPPAPPSPTPPASECSQADISQDGVVNLADFTILANNFMSAHPANGRADINGDGSVNLADFTILAGHFMQNCN